MEPMTMMAMAAAAKGLFDLVGAIGGSIASSDERAEAERLARQAYEKVLAVGAPPNMAKRIFLEEFKF